MARGEAGPPVLPVLLSVQCRLVANSKAHTWCCKNRHSQAPCSMMSLFSHSVVSNSATPWTAGRQASLSFTISQSLLRLMSIESVMPSNHLILCCLLLLLPSVCPSIRVFSSESALHNRRPKFWSLYHVVYTPQKQDISPQKTTRHAVTTYSLHIVKRNANFHVFSNTAVQKHQFFSAQLSLQSN